MNISKEIIQAEKQVKKLERTNPNSDRYVEAVRDLNKLIAIESKKISKKVGMNIKFMRSLTSQELSTLKKWGYTEKQARRACNNDLFMDLKNKNKFLSRMGERFIWDGSRILLLIGGNIQFSSRKIRVFDENFIYSAVSDLNLLLSTNWKCGGESLNGSALNMIIEGLILSGGEFIS